MKVTSNLTKGRKCRKTKTSFPKKSVENARLAETCIEQNNDYTRIMHETQFRSSFKSLSLALQRCSI